MEALTRNRPWRLPSQSAWYVPSLAAKRLEFGLGRLNGHRDQTAEQLQPDES